MLPEIATMNGNICNFERTFGVTFARGSAGVNWDQNLECLHFIAYEWTRPNVATNKRILSLIAGIDPSNNQGGFATIVLVNSGSTFTGYEIWDINSNVLATGNVSTSGPNYAGDSSPQILDSLVGTAHNVSVSLNTTNKTIRIQATLDVDFGFFSIDVYQIDVTIFYGNLFPI